MTQDNGICLGPSSLDGVTSASDARRIPGERFAHLWHSEVPKVVERHESERLQVRRSLGLIS